jgi:hypothetical protein
MLTLLQEVPAWLSLLVAGGGVVVSAIHMGRTRWAVVLLGGFFAETVAMAFSRLAVLGMRHGVTTTTSVGGALFLASLIGLAGRVAVVGGISGALSELRARSNGQPV